MTPGRRILQLLGIEHQDADFAGDQKIADLVGRGDMPQPPRAPERFAQRLQERSVARQYDELDDIARELEPESTGPRRRRRSPAITARLSSVNERRRRTVLLCSNRRSCGPLGPACMSAQTGLYDTASANPDNRCCDAPKRFCDSPHSAAIWS
jgi:hypothetical protein